MTSNMDFSPPPAPWPLLDAWMGDAKKAEPNDPDAMSLATVGSDGMPSVRIVLLRGLDEKGFTFFTNRQSRKGMEMEKHAKAALCLHWKSLRRQIRAEGAIAFASDAESDAYFASRPRGSQIGAWASKQSETLASRADLERAVAEVEKRFEGKPVPRPPYWGGYRLTPTKIEFWQDREFRLHDRFVYRRATASSPWIVERLYP